MGHKIYAPWKETITGHWQKWGECFYRKNMNGNNNIYVEFFWIHKNKSYWRFNEDYASVTLNFFDIKYQSKEEAIAAIDKIILDRGDRILTQEEYDKFMVLT